MIEFYVNKKANAIPASFDEFEAKHWFCFIKSLCSPKTETWEDVKVVFLKKFTSIPFKKIAKLQKDYANKDEYLEHCSKIALLAENLNYFEKGIKINKNPIPVLNVAGKTFYPPADGLANMRVWEMAYSSSYSKSCPVSIEELKSSDELNNLIAVIYRPGRLYWKFFRRFGISPDDRRRKFFDANIQENAKIIAKLPEHLKITILYWFNTQYETFTSNFPELFETDPSKIEKNNEDKDAFSWADMLITAEGSSSGDEEKIANSYASFFLRRLVLEKKRIESLKPKN